MRQLACLILMLGVLPVMSDAQYWREVVSNSDNYFEIVSTVDAYYENRDKGKGSGYKQYMRWKGSMEYRINPDGLIRNVEALNLQAYQKAQYRPEVQYMRAVHGDWTNVGPFDYTVYDVHSQGGLGRVNCLAFDPTNSQIILAGTPAGGLWRTTDGGTTWSPKTEAFASIGISGIAIDHYNPDIWYILTGDGDGGDTRSIGVMRTTDGGTTWAPTDLSFGVTDNKRGYTLMMHPVNPGILFVGMAGDGIWRTSNGGATWTQVDSNRTVWDIEFKPGSPTNMYAASSDGFLRSDDGGVTWYLDNDPSFPTAFTRMAITVGTAQPDRVYAIFGGDFNPGQFRGAYRSFDSGSTFSMSANTPNILDATMNGTDSTDQAGYDLAYIVDPNDGFTLYSGGINVWKSNDAGVLWNRITWWTRLVQPYVHADFHNFYFVGDTLFAVNDGGIYRTQDGGSSWTEISSGICNMQFYQIDVHNNEWMGGTQDNGTNLGPTGGSDCDQLMGGDGFGCVWHTGDGSIKYITSQNNLVRRQFGSNVTIWNENDGFWFTEIEMHTTDPNFFFFGKGPDMYRANQSGAVWDFNFDSLGTSPLLPDGGIRGIAQGTSDPDVMYVVNKDRLLKTSDLSSTFPMWDTLPNPAFGQAFLSDAAVDPNDPDRVWIVCSGYNSMIKAFFSSDGGMTWTNISSGIPNVPVQCIEYHPGSNDDLYIGTEIGIFFKDASLTDWLYFSTYLANTQVRDIEISGGYVYAGTHGRGIWRSPVYSCPGSLTLTPANDPNPMSIGQREFNAISSITSTRVIQGNYANVRYGAGSYVDLKPGFWAKKGNELRAKIEGCPN